MQGRCYFKIMRDGELTSSLPAIENIEELVKKEYPTPLWYLLNSELETIGLYALPTVSDVLASRVQLHVHERLKELAAPHLEISSEELTIVIGNAKPSSILGPHEI